MTEKQLWQKIKKKLPGVAERVENVLMPGMPDACGDCEEGGYWVELKCGTDRDKDKGLNPNQLAWVARHVLRGAVVFVIIDLDGSRYKIFRVMINKPLRTGQDILYYKSITIEGMPREIERREG